MLFEMMIDGEKLLESRYDRRREQGSARCEQESAGNSYSSASLPETQLNTIT